MKKPLHMTIYELHQCNVIEKLEKRIAELDSLVISLGDNNDELFKDRNQALEKIEALRITIAELQAEQTWVSVRLYNAGYAAGHDDTVEARYTDVADCDKDTYHADIVAELIEHYLSAQPSGEGVSGA
jgi:hypothetical protein